MRGVQGEVDDSDADRDEALGRRAIWRAAREPDATRHHGQSEDEPREHATRGPDPLLLEGVLEEEADPEEEEDRSHAGEPGSAEPTLPLPDARGAPGFRGAGLGGRRLARRRGRRLERDRVGGRGRDGRRFRRSDRLEDGLGRRDVRSRRRRQRRGRRDRVRGRCRRRARGSGAPRVALQIEQARLEPAHLAPEAQEHQHEDENDDRGREEEQPERNQRNDRQPTHVLAVMIAPGRTGGLGTSRFGKGARRRAEAAGERLRSRGLGERGAGRNARLLPARHPGPGLRLRLGDERAERTGGRPTIPWPRSFPATSRGVDAPSGEDCAATRRRLIVRRLNRRHRRPARASRRWPSTPAAGRRDSCGRRTSAPRA